MQEKRTKFCYQEYMCISCIRIFVFLLVCLLMLSACEKLTGNSLESSTTQATETSFYPEDITTDGGDVSEPETLPSEDSASVNRSFQDIPRIPATQKQYLNFINTVDDENILPDPTTHPIYWDDLEALSASQLSLLRNEIYARHGYVFQSKELNDYFSQKSWYHPDPNIKEIELSNMEKENLNNIKYQEDKKPFILIGGNILSWDLDGDGKQELIQFDAPGYDRYTLHVNDGTITAVGDNLMGYCSVIDLDTSDSQCEIMVRSMGPSNDDSFQLFRWKNDRIDLIGQVDGLLNEVPGNGYCSIWIRASILQTWFLQDLYKLNKEGVLTNVDQDIYPVSAEIKMSDGKAVLQEKPFDFSKYQGEGTYMYAMNIVNMLQDLPVVISPDNSQPAGVLKKGERIVFLGSDNKQWVKIQGESGVIGWFELQRFGYIVLDGKEYTADYFFENLDNAD